jgi:hypothetical protein
MLSLVQILISAVVHAMWGKGKGIASKKKVCQSALIL